MRVFLPLLILTAVIPGSPAQIYSSEQISETGDKLLGKGLQFASAELGRYKSHYAMLAVRNRTGSAEVHEHEADYFIVEKGGGTLVTGGKLVSPHIQKAGEIRGTSIEGGERHPLGTGDVVHIPAGEPHQLVLEKGKPISYFVVKVSGQ